MRQFWLEGEDWRFVCHGVAILLGALSSCAEVAVDAMAARTGTGKKALRLPFLPAEALKDACAQAKAIQPPWSHPQSPPLGKMTAAWRSSARTSALSVHAGTAASAGEWLKSDRQPDLRRAGVRHAPPAQAAAEA